VSAPVPLHPRDIEITRNGLLAGEPAGTGTADAATPNHDGAMERRR
jgi:hypothetical protein